MIIDDYIMGFIKMESHWESRAYDGLAYSIASDGNIRIVAQLWYYLSQ